MRSGKKLAAWFKMVGWKDCKRGACPCADKIRQIVIHIPIDDPDELKNNELLKRLEKKYFVCYNADRLS